MFKRFLSVCLCLTMVMGLVPAISLISEPATASAGVYVMPSTDGKTNNQTYTLGAGTDVNVPVYTDWRSTSMSPTATMTPAYIAIHCTGSYPSTSTAKANHNYGKTATNACWHYTVGDKDIYQLLADNRQGWHVGTSYTGAPSNKNSIGLELAVNNFPATETFGGERWTDGDAIMAWWDSQFHQTVKNAAYLTAVLCQRWGLDWQTRVKMHWDSKSYESGASGKDCPMQMRATYNPSTNAFTPAGTYKNGRDGYYWQFFWKYLEAYANGAPSVEGYTTASAIGTYQVKSSDGLNVRSGASTSYDLVGVLENGAIVEVTELSGNWGKVTLEDGTVGWCSIVNYGNYIGIDTLAYENKAAWGEASTSIDSNGSMTIVNSSATETVGYDFLLPVQIGTATTPYLSLQITPNYGSGYYFGLSQYGSGYYMMRDCQSSDQLVAATSAPYMTGTEKLEINLKDWWKSSDGYRIDNVRVYVAPSSSITINYLYFTDASGEVTDTRFNLLSADSNVNLMIPSTLDIADRTRAGSYNYHNGMLTVVSDTEAGFDVVFNVNMEVDPNVLTRFLMSVAAGVRYDIELLCETSDGERIFSLRDDWYPGLCTAPDGDFIPAAEQSAGLDFLSCFTYNQVLPADGLSTVKSVKVRVGGKGTVIVNSLQLAENDRLLVFRDGLSKQDSCTGAVEPDPTPTPDYTSGDVNLDGELTTTDAREVLLFTIDTVTFTDAQKLAADFNGDGEITTSDARDMLLSVIA